MTLEHVGHDTRDELLVAVAVRELVVGSVVRAKEELEDVQAPVVKLFLGRPRRALVAGRREGRVR